MLDDKGKQVNEAGSIACRSKCSAWRRADGRRYADRGRKRARAREVAAYRQEGHRQAHHVRPASLENMFSALKAKQTVIEYPVVVKADVQGSVEAINNALNKISNDEIKVRILIRASARSPKAT
jgi:translation initiation factor IF-2